MDYSIGTLAALTGVSVKTIRFYSDEGILSAPERTAAGYRRFTDDHRAHLELVRTLREIGVDLATIRSLGRRPLKDVLALHLRSVETQLTALQRTRTVLRATLEKDDPTDADLRRLHALGRLGQAEQAMLLDSFVDQVGGGIHARHQWLASMRECMLPDLPEEPTTAQLDAWLELTALLADDDFRDSLRRSTDDFWSEPDNLDAWRQTVTVMVDEIGKAGVAPDSPEAAPVLARILELTGQTREEWLRVFDEHDPRAERLWRLVAIIRGVEYRPPPTALAYSWLERALRHSAGEPERG
ncbi:MerR family transcriptional regulator [Nonomuraea sp. B12E4]|uniref:helix-turn-helix domain-containing protein n=1 Tax=Nonomuraea sp. B12E4 TaxID=3153564 RepID=UPI00325E49D3